MNLKNLAFFIFIAVFFNACSSKESILNLPLNSNEPIPKTKPIKNDSNLALILSFSGGGTRAAALSYGVLKELKKQKLLKKVDIISSVSGGSFTSAYFGLYGDKIFEDFESKFLKKPIQTRLIDTILNPLNWFDYSLSNRSDYVANFYEKEIFGKKHFSDLREKPKIIINATDISTGNAFAFTKENFAKICSNLELYPIGKAVTASSAVPGVFSPITLKNYATCKKTKQAIDKNTSFLIYNDTLSHKMQKYFNTDKYPYLHLVDGGITDNLGLRSLFNSIAELDNDFVKVMQTYGISNTDKIAFIVVNAADSLNPTISLSKENPHIQDVIDATSTIQLKRYNADTLDMLNYYIFEWKKQIKKHRCKNQTKPCYELKFYLIELNFNQLPEKRAKILLQTKTSLELPPKRVNELIKAGETLLRNSKEFQRLLRDLD